MKKLISYISIITCGVLMLSALAMYVVNMGLKKQQNNSFYTLNHVFDSNENHDLLMIGHSRSKNCINPKIVDSICGTNSFNSGNYDYIIYECKLMLELYLASNHPKPKYILFVLDNEIVNTDTKAYFPEQFFPYIHNDIIYKSLYGRCNDYFLVRYFPFVGITRYNDYMKYLAFKAYRNPASTDIHAYKGFSPMNGDSAQRSENLKYIDVEPTQKGLTMLDEFFTITKKNNIKVMVLFPGFLTDTNVVREPVLTQNFFNLVNKVIVKYDNLKVVDMSHSEFNYHKEYYFDEGHLNLRGSAEYSKMIADSLKIMMNIGGLKK